MQAEDFVALVLDFAVPTSHAPLRTTSSLWQDRAYLFRPPDVLVVASKELMSHREESG